jgi:hypothetical protein
MYKYLSKIYKLNDKSQRKRYLKRLNWNFQKERVLNTFKKLADDSVNGAFIDRLYVSEDRELRQVQLHSGRHPVGLYIESSDEYDVKYDNKVKLDVESGAAIVLSQSSSGEVVVILYSFTSKQRKPNIDKLVWSVLSSPDDLTLDVIAQIVSDFFILSRFTSALYTESYWDRFKIIYLSFKGSHYIPKKRMTNILLNHWIVLLVGFIGSVCSIFGIFLSNST